MNNKMVIDALSGLNVPVAFLKYTGTAKPYITFFFYNERGEVFAENEEVATRYSLQVDVWSSGNYTALVNQVKDALKSVGFSRIDAKDLYEDDTKIYHKAMFFRYTDIV